MRILILCGSLSLVLSGCLMAPSMEDMKMMMAKPERPAEMKMLDKMIGSWEMTGEMVTPMPAEMMALMDDGSGETPEKITKAEMTNSWCLDGMFMKSESTHDAPGGGKLTFQEYRTWDPAKGKFRQWWFSNWGETGEGWMSFTADGKSCTMQGRGMTPNGIKKSYYGTMDFLDNDTMKWTYTEHGPFGPMTMEGTSKRK